MSGLPVVILAGGEARRMGGGDKGLAPLGGRPLLAHVIARLRPAAGPMALSANGDPARFAAWGLPVLADAAPAGAGGAALGGAAEGRGGARQGPLAGVLSAMDWAAGLGAEQVATAPWDTPFLPRDLLARLAEAARAEGAPIALASGPDAEGREALHPAVGLWSCALREELRAALAAGTRRVRGWAAAQGHATARFAGPPDPFFNINTPADMAQAERIWRAMARGSASPSAPGKDEA
ncbi:molybdenum cofactor guanylyltransferase MobA [Albimonas pacifica]|uniref:Molybdenum cofactor guanylyltransferase n=1 Tax=Albimonas pacifica TaxID=1114924 RepID=A0A1I3F2D4_9RHOB|nr:molybdenum cofactor guanylyltransferase MobA [Albimonas pacifica]SFI05348.1 molybdenum cofactor guanylyltransferase [Albimonas pacifica]